eukprot:PhF_6_TR31514/c2_g1_i1/m.46435/K08829/MAK; male germ cell-associated kinase
MDRFEIVKQIGDGTFGSVFKAINKKTKEVVAIKRMKQKYYSWEQCMQLREVAALRKLNNHPNIVKLKEVVREQTDLYFIFEFMDGGDLLHLMKQHQGQRIPHTRIRNIMFQVMQSLSYIHRQGYFHRDMKPENILIRINSAEDYAVKIADFGLAKEVRCKPPLTDYVSTRWYRAPEVLLQDKTYNSPIDLWACGCILAELYMLRPLFPGTSEVDELFKITSVLGTPTEQTFPDGLRLAKQIRYTFPVMSPTSLSQILPKGTPAVAIDFMEKLMMWDPKQRLTAATALQHPYFTVMVDADDLGIPSHMMQKKAPEREAISAPPTTLNSPHPTVELPTVQKQERVASRGTVQGKESSLPPLGNAVPFTSKTNAAAPNLMTQQHQPGGGGTGGGGVTASSPLHNATQQTLSNLLDVYPNSHQQPSTLNQPPGGGHSSAQKGSSNNSVSDILSPLHQPEFGGTGGSAPRRTSAAADMPRTGGLGGTNNLTSNRLNSGTPQSDNNSTPSWLLDGPSSNPQQDREIASLLSGARYVVGKNTGAGAGGNGLGGGGGVYGGGGAGGGGGGGSLPPVAPPTYSALKSMPSAPNNNNSNTGGAYTFGTSSFGMSSGNNMNTNSTNTNSNTTSITGMRKPSWGTTKFPMMPPVVKKAP